MARRIGIILLLLAGAVSAGAADKVYWHLSLNMVKNYLPDTRVGFLDLRKGFQGQQNEWAWFTFVEIPGGDVSPAMPAFERKVRGNLEVNYLGFVQGAALREGGEIDCVHPKGFCSTYEGAELLKVTWDKSWAEGPRAHGYIYYSLPTRMEPPRYRIDYFVIFFAAPQYLNAEGRWIISVPSVVPLNRRPELLKPYKIFYDQPYMDVVTNKGKFQEPYDSLFEMAFELQEEDLPLEAGKLHVVQPFTTERTRAAEVWSYMFFRSDTSLHPQWRQKFVH